MLPLWEYRTIVLSGSAGHWESLLCNEGERNWELVQVVPTSSVTGPIFVAIFKRIKQ